MRAPAAVAVVLTLAACASDPAPPSNATTGPPPALRFSCGDPAFTFPPAALTGPIGAELFPDPAAATLRAHLAGDGPDFEWLPDAGWRRLVDTGAGVLFQAANPGPDAAAGSMVFVAVAVSAEGWQVTGWGECQPEPVLGPAIGVARWWPDPAKPIPEVASTGLDVLLVERACASGRPPVGRVLAPVVTSAPDAVTILLAVRSAGGGQDCQGNPPFALRVELPEPLGERRLLDGSTLPPRDPVPEA
jgi:hypothetical protein